MKRRRLGVAIALAAMLAAGAWATSAVSNAERRVAGGDSLALAPGIRRSFDTLRVCADPNNLPFSDSTGAGFENRLAALVAGELGAELRYTWWAQRRGFVRNTLNTGACDVIMGVPTSFELVLVTRPYYRSTYVFVTREDRRIAIRSFDDDVLRRVRVAVQLIGDDGANSPPAHALGRRGIVRNVRGFPVYGDYREPSPPARIVEAVARGDVDVAVVWGPLAGYFAARDSVPLALTPVSPQVDVPFLPLVFDISMGVRRADSTFRDTLDAILTRRRAAIDSLLSAYDVPVIGARSSGFGARRPRGRPARRGLPEVANPEPRDPTSESSNPESRGPSSETSEPHTPRSELR